LYSSASGHCVLGICSGSQLPIGSTCLESGDCSNGVACALETEIEGALTICCPSGTSSLSTVLEVGSNDVCDGGQSLNGYCSEDWFCSSGLCIGSICVANTLSPGELCEWDNHCTNEACALEFEDENLAEYICCPSGSYAWAPGIDDHVCTEQADDSQCSSNSLCLSEICVEGYCQGYPALIDEVCDSHNDCSNLSCGLDPHVSSSSYVCCSSGSTSFNLAVGDYDCL